MEIRVADDPDRLADVAGLVWRDGPRDHAYAEGARLLRGGAPLAADRIETRPGVGVAVIEVGPGRYGFEVVGDGIG